MSHYKICFKKHKLCAIPSHQWDDYDTLIQIGKLRTDLRMEFIYQ